jgi:hypothetical protein
MAEALLFSLSVTVSVTEYVPGEVYRWVGVDPVAVREPSPKDQTKRTM